MLHLQLLLQQLEAISRRHINLLILLLSLLSFRVRDLTTTLLLAAGIQPPVSMAGINLLADPVVKNRGPVFGECFQHDAADLERPAASLTYRFMVDGPLKLVVPNPATVQAEKKPGRGLGKELYDLAADPLEEKNLLATRAEDAARLEKKLDAWWKP